MDLFNYTVQAIQGTISSSTSRQQRQEYQAFLVQLKDSQECSNVLCRILTTVHFEGVSPTDIESIFIVSLSLLHDWIRKWWDKIQPAQQLNIRQICSELLSQSTTLPHTSNYSSKLASILADLVERQFPQQWPTFIVDVKTIWMDGPAFKQEIILKTLQFVLTDCTDSDFTAQLSSKRAQEIIGGFHASQEDVLDISFQYFAMNLMTVLETQDNARINESKRCVTLLLQFVRSLSSIVPNAALLHANRNFVFLLIKALAVDGLQLESMLTFETIAKQSIEFNDLSAVLELFYSADKRIVLPEDASDSIAFVNAYMKTLSLLLSVNTDNVFHANHVMHGKAEALLQDLLTCLRRPQRRVAVDVCADLIKMFKNSSASNLANLDSVAKSILSCYLEKSQRPKFIVDDSLDEEEWFELEFDDREDWQAYASSVTNQTLHLSILFCEKYPLTMVSFFVESIQALMVTEQELVAQFPHWSTTKRKDALMELKARVQTLTHIFQSSLQSIVSTIKTQSVDQLPHCMRIAEHLWQWKPQGCYLFKLRLKLLASCFPVFQDIPGPLLPMLEFLFSLVNSPPKEKLSPDAESLSGIVSNEQYLASDAKEEAANALSLLIQKCPQAFTSEQIWIQLLTTVTTICRGSTHSVGIQDSMRDALVSLSFHTKNAQLCREVLDIAFVELLQRVKEIVQEVFVSPEVVLQAIITPIDERNTPEQQGKEPTQMTTVFLYRSNRLRQLLQTFLNSVNKVDPTVAVSVCERLWSATAIPSLEDLQTLFPLTVYWLEMLRVIAPALAVLQDLWSPRIFQLLSSSPVYENVMRGVYGLSVIDGCKKCKLPNPLDGAVSAEIKTEGILKDMFLGLFSVFFKVFGVAAKQCVLWPLILHSQVNVDAIVLNSVYLEHNHYSFFVKYFAEQVTLNVLPIARGNLLQLLQFFVQSQQRRISLGWAETNSVNNEEERQLDLLYRQCFLFSQYFAADHQQMIRTAMVRESTQCIVDTLSNALALKGELALKAETDTKNALSSRLAEQRKALLWSLYFGTQADSAALLATIKQMLLLLVQVPDGTCCKQALAIVTLILKHAEKEKHLVSFVAEECFRAVLNILLQAAPWSQGLEWDLIEFLLEDIRTHDLIDEASPPKQDKRSGKNAMNSWSSPKKTIRCLQIFAESKVTDANELKTLQDQLQQNNTIKKKKLQRDTLKDFISVLLQRLHGTESLQAAGSVMVKVDPKVSDLSNDPREKPKKTIVKAPVSEAHIGDLFDDI